MRVFLLAVLAMLGLARRSAAQPSDRIDFAIEDVDKIYFDNGTALPLNQTSLQQYKSTGKPGYTLGGFAAAGYMWMSGYKDFDAIINTAAYRRRRNSVGPHCLVTPFLRLAVGNIFWFGMGVTGGEIMAVASQWTDSTLRMRLDQADRFMRSDDFGPVLSITDFGYNLPHHFAEQVRMINNGTMTREEVFGSASPTIVKTWYERFWGHG